MTASFAVSESLMLRWLVPVPSRQISVTCHFPAWKRARKWVLLGIPSFVYLRGKLCARGSHSISVPSSAFCEILWESHPVIFPSAALIHFWMSAVSMVHAVQRFWISSSHGCSFASVTARSSSVASFRDTGFRSAIFVPSFRARGPCLI